MIAEDSDFQLWNVVLFENCVDEFTGKCKETCAGGKGNFLVSRHTVLPSLSGSEVDPFVACHEMHSLTVLLMPALLCFRRMQR